MRGGKDVMDTFTGNDGQLRELALFAGAGGGILGGHLLGWRTVCAVEIEPYAAGVLVARQNDGILPPFPVWDDVCTFDGRPWRGRVDVISGGFPCQDISIAGKGKGLEGERSGLWREMARVIGEVRPRYVLVENSPMLTVRGGARVIGDLAEMGYDCRWGIVSAADAGAPHKRERIWIYASDASQSGRDCWECDKSGRHLLHNGNGNAEESDAARSGWKRRTGEACEKVADTEEIGRIECGIAEDKSSARIERQTVPASGGGVRYSGEEWWGSEPGVCRVVDGGPARVERLEALGNAQVPRVVEIAWKMLGGGIA